MSFVADLDTPLLRLSPGNVFRARDAAEGLIAYGRIGSGKSSGTATAVARAYLRAGMGGIVHVAKYEEIDNWLRLARESGRERSVIVFDESRGFNFINYELARLGAAGLGSVVELLMRVLESSDAAAGGSAGRESDKFWAESIRQVLRYCLPLLYSALGTITVAAIIDFVTTAATDGKLYLDPGFASGSFAAEVLRRFVKQPAVPLPEAEARELLVYWFEQYPAIPSKTRGNIVVSVSARLDRFKHGRMRRCYCDATDIVPEMTFHGAIILLAQPALTWQEDGVVGQQLFKFCWQRAVESRNALPLPQRARFVFCFADECQYFLNPKDEEFLSTCRASRACVVYLTQNLPTLYSRLGKERSDTVDGIVGKFATQVFHNNSCSKTNNYAAELVGKDIQWRANESRSRGTNRSRGMSEGTNTSRGTSSGKGMSFGSNGGGWNDNSGTSSGSGENWGANVGGGTNTSTSYGASEQIDFLLQPRLFATELQTGGPANGNEVTAVWFQAGRTFRGGLTDNTLLAKFRQR